MQRSMRAAMVIDPGRISVEHVPIPTFAAHEVRIKVEGCGVCASNLGPWKGLPWQTYPIEAGGLGHEAWGTIDAVGADVTGWSERDRVTGLTFRSFADFDIVDPRFLVKIPDILQGEPLPGEPLGCAINIFRRSAIVPGQQVAIIGIGFLGALLTRLAADAGAQVVAISRRTSSLDLARRCGAAHVVVMHDHATILDEVQRITAGQGCARVIEAVGLQWPLDLAGDLVAEGGRLIIAGYHQDGRRDVNMQAWNWKGIDVINAHERNFGVCVDGIRQAVFAIADGRLDPSPLYTHRFPLERLGEALDATRDKPDGFVKALVLCGGAA